MHQGLLLAILALIVLALIVVTLSVLVVLRRVHSRLKDKPVVLPDWKPPLTAPNRERSQSGDGEGLFARQITSVGKATGDEDHEIAQVEHPFRTPDEPMQRIPQHVFISYSHQDREYVGRFIADLRAAGIPVWIDHEGLRAGTPNWERAIRQAIGASFAMLLIVSPDSQDSNVVQGEVAIARARDCPIIPLWARGETWEDSVPVDLIRAQRFDGREQQYSAQLPAIITALREMINARAPRIITLNGPYDLPQDYLHIFVERTNTHLAIRPAAFTSLDELLEALYLPYLSSTYRPFTYGRAYLLCSREQIGFRLLAVPWLWLVHHGDDMPLSALSGSWASSPLTAYGLVAGSEWEMIDAVECPFGIATDVEELGHAVLSVSGRGGSHRKEILMLKDAADGVASHRGGAFEQGRNYLRVQAPGAVDEQKYGHRFVLALGHGERSEALTEKAIVYHGPWQRSSEVFRFLDQARR